MKNHEIHIKRKFLTFFALGLLTACSALKEEKVTKQQVQKNLFDSISQEDVKGVESLIESGVDVNIYDNQGYTPLMRAVKSQDSNLVEELINAGSKVYQPHKDHKYLTAFDMIDEGAKEMRRIFDNKSQNYGETLKEFIVSRNYKQALEFSANHYLPVDLLMPHSQMTSIQLIAETYGSPKKENKIQDIEGLVEYIRYLSKNTEFKPNYFIEHEDSFRIIVKAIDDPVLFAVVKDAYMNINGSSIGIPILKKDQSDIDWLILKIQAMGQIGQLIPVEDPHVSIYWEAINSHLLEYPDKCKTLVQIVLFAQDPDEANKMQKVKFFEWTLNTILRSIEDKPSSSLFALAQEVLKIWELSLLPNSKHTAETPLFNLLRAITSISGDYEFESIIDLTERLLAFGTGKFNLSKESFISLATSGLKRSQKIEILRKINDSTNNWLYSGFLSDIIVEGGFDAIDLIGASSKTYTYNNLKSQEDAIATALSHSRSSNEAKSMLDLLYKMNININTQYGLRALHIAFAKLWEGDDGYKELINFLLSEELSIVSMIERQDIISILIRQIRFIRKEKKGLDLMEKFLTLTQRELEPVEYDYTEFVSLNLGEVAPMRVSLVWDYILASYEIYKISQGHIVKISNVLSQLLTMFPEEKFSMSFKKGDIYVRYKETKNHSLFSRMLPLSFILSIGHKSIESTLLLESAQVDGIHVESNFPEFSWRAFLSGEVYSYYSKAPEFWEGITETILSSEHSKHGLDLPDEQSSIDFMRIAVQSGQMSRYPDLANLLIQEKVSIPNNQDLCSLDEKTIHLIDSQEIVYSELISGEIIPPSQREFLESKGEELNVIKTFTAPPYWSYLGIFEVLRPLKEKTCGMLKVSADEIYFLKKFITEHIDPLLKREFTQGFDRETNSYTSRKSYCFHPSFVIDKGDETTASYSFTGEWLISNKELGDGTLTYKSNSLQKDCYTYYPNKQVKFMAIKQFLNSWYGCAVKRNDESLLMAFKEFEGLQLTPQEPFIKEVYTCQKKRL